jgi:hypothetical protein
MNKVDTVRSPAMRGHAALCRPSPRVTAIRPSHRQRQVTGGDGSWPRSTGQGGLSAGIRDYARRPIHADRRDRLPRAAAYLREHVHRPPPARPIYGNTWIGRLPPQTKGNLSALADGCVSSLVRCLKRGPREGNSE